MQTWFKRLCAPWRALSQPARIGIAAAVLVTADQLYGSAGDSVVPGGPLDETAHIATAWLILQALPGRIRERFFWPAIIGSFAIDIDHVPGTLGYQFLTHGTPRPYTHSLLTLVVLCLVGLAWDRRRDIFWGLALGLAMHLFRDLAEQPGGGVSLFWPLTNRAFSYSHALYLWLMAGVAAFDLAKYAVARRRSRVQIAR